MKAKVEIRHCVRSGEFHPERRRSEWIQFIQYYHIIIPLPVPVCSYLNQNPVPNNRRVKVKNAIEGASSGAWR